MKRSRHAAVISKVAAVVACGLCSGAVSAAAPQAKSDIKGASLVSMATLARSPEDRSLDDYCSGYRAEKLSAVARQVEKLGWIVTSEAPLGRYRVVTFVSGFDPGTSALCFARNANIGIFDGANLVALAYTTPASAWHLGTVEPLESGGLLVWSGDGPTAPIGELHEANGGLRLTAVARERTFCNHRAVVPNIYGKPLDTARKVLIAHGWRPQRPNEKPARWDGAAKLAKHGVIEAETCAGTGVGYCKFNYESKAGGLSVTTVGGDPNPKNDTVVFYDVACG